MSRLPVVIAAAAIAAASAAAAVEQTPAARPRITGIHHVAFRVSDAGAAQRFYGDVLGLGLHAPARPERIVYAVGSRQRVVIEPGLRPDEDERLSHLAFETADIRSLEAHLKARGVDVRRPAERCQEDAIRVVDPDGHPIEFVPARWPPDRDAPADARALSTRLLHAGLIVRDEAAAHAFYRDTLGFSEIWRGGRKEGVTQWVYMRVPDGTDYLEYMLASAPPDRRQRGTQHHLCLQVPSIQAAWEEVARRTPDGARAQLAPPQVGVNGRWQLNLFDPDGTRSELMEPFTVR
jgi:catechol 2,3-dioxygenase-like lactoylglutathione lyase family enzyme